MDESEFSPVVVVDDSLPDAELAVAALQSGGLPNPIVVLRDGGDVLDYFYRRGRHSGGPTALPALVFMDLKMPKVDGAEALRQLKEDPVYRDVPIVMLSSSREKEDVERCYALGANGYIVKPVDFLEFVPLVQQAARFWTRLNRRPRRSGG